MAGVLFQIGRASRTGEVSWTSDVPIVAAANEEIALTGNITPAQMSDPTKEVWWEVWRGTDPLNDATFLRLASGRWRGGPEASNPELSLPADIITGFYLRGKAIITGTVNFGLTIETRVITAP